MVNGSGPDIRVGSLRKLRMPTGHSVLLRPAELRGLRERDSSKKQAGSTGEYMVIVR